MSLLPPPPHALLGALKNRSCMRHISNPSGITLKGGGGEDYTSNRLFLKIHKIVIQCEKAAVSTSFVQDCTFEGFSFKIFHTVSKENWITSKNVHRA